jgi:hypothetical protein
VDHGRLKRDSDRWLWLSDTSERHSDVFLGAETVSSGYGNCDIATSGIPNDILIRVQRNLSNSILIGEIYNTATGAQFGSTCSYTITGAASGSAISAYGISIGATGATGQLAFIRWYNTTVLPGASFLVGAPSPAATYLDNEWGPSPGNETDTNSGGFTGQNLTGISSYISTIPYSPTCQPKQQTAQLGTSLLITNPSCVPLDGGSTLTYAWSSAGTGADGINSRPSSPGRRRQLRPFLTCEHSAH